MSGTPRSDGTGAGVAVVVGIVTTALAGVAMWRSPAPWTFTLDTGSVFLGQTLPAFREWFAGRIPEWSDMLWGGFPLVGDCTSAVLYPLHAVAYLATLRAPLRFFDVAFALHLGIFAAGSAVLVRRLGGSTAAAVLAALLAATTPVAHWSAIAYFPVFGAHTWWPWTFVAVEALTRPATPLVGAAMLLGWVAIAAQVLVGVPEQMTYCVVPAALWLLARPTPLGLGQRIVRLTVLGLGALALAAPQLLPTALILPWTHRAGTPPEFQLGSLWLTDPVRLLVPGHGALNGLPSFLGIATLGLAIVAAATRRATFLLVAAGLAFALALGPQVGLYEWLHRVPPFSHFRNPAKIYALAEYAVVWLAALGADALWRRSSRAAHVAALVLVAAVLGERAAYLRLDMPAIDRRTSSDALEPARYERLASLTRLQRRSLTAPPPVTQDAGGPYGGEYARSIGTLLGMSTLRAGNVALLSPAHFALLSQPRPLALERLGADFLLAPESKCDAIERRFRWPLVERSADDCLYASPRPSRRHVLLDRIAPVSSAEEMVTAMSASGPGMPIVAPANAFGALGRGIVDVESYAPGHATLRSVTDAPGLVLVRDSLAPGWAVRVDDRPVAPIPAAGLYFAVPVETGVHRIALDYRAPGLRTGFAISAGWAVGALITIVVARRRRTGTP